MRCLVNVETCFGLTGTLDFNHVCNPIWSLGFADQRVFEMDVCRWREEETEENSGEFRAHGELSRCFVSTTARVHNHWSTTRSARATKPPIAAATARPTRSGNNHPLTTWAARATRTSHALWHVRNEVGPDLIAVQDLDIRHLSARKGSQNRRASNFVGHQGLDLYLAHQIAVTHDTAR